MQCNKNFDDDSILSFVIHPQNDPARGQVQFSHNLIAILFKKGNSTWTQDFPQISIERQIFEHYIKNICNITSHYEIFTIEILLAQSITNRWYRSRILKSFHRVQKVYNIIIHKKINQLHKACFPYYL